MLAHETVLRTIVAALREQVAPAVGDAFAADVLRMATGQLGLIANAIDGAVALRVAENARVRTLLAEGAATLADRDLAARAEAASGSADPGLRISELDAENRSLIALLIEVHAAVEADPGPAARDLDRRIWRELAVIEATRAPRD